jgi:hypothetical protein
MVERRERADSHRHEPRTDKQTEKENKMALRMQITPDDFKRSTIVKPGWYPTLVKDVGEEMNAKKDAMNIVLDLENADKEAGFLGVPCKHWMSEKGVSFAGGAASFFKAFNPKLDETQIVNVDFESYKGRYIYAKWITFRGKEGNDPPQNRIEDWAPLPKKYQDLAEAVVSITDGIEGFARV